MRLTHACATISSIPFELRDTPIKMEKTREESHYGEKPTTEQKLETRRSETGTEHHRQGSN